MRKKELRLALKLAQAHSRRSETRLLETANRVRYWRKVAEEARAGKPAPERIPCTYLEVKAAERKFLATGEVSH